MGAEVYNLLFGDAEDVQRCVKALGFLRSAAESCADSLTPTQHTYMLTVQTASLLWDVLVHLETLLEAMRGPRPRIISTWPKLYSYDSLPTNSESS